MLADVDDAIAEAILNAVKYPPPEPVKNVAGWLFVAARRCLSSSLQRLNGEASMTLEELTEVSDSLQRQETDHTEDTYALHMDLMKAFNRLTPYDRGIATAYFRDRYTECELAEKYNVCQAKMHRAIARIETYLRESLAEYREIL